MKNIVLIGMPGCGKSTVGVLLAKSAGMGFVDTDLLLQNTQKRLLYEILSEEGIDAFLQKEAAAVCAMECFNCVIATGGSVVYESEAMAHLKALGSVVYLRASVGELEKRLRNIRTRGVVMGKGKTVRDLYDERRPLYERYADFTVDAAGEPEDVVEQLMKIIEGDPDEL